MNTVCDVNLKIGSPIIVLQILNRLCDYGYDIKKFMKNIVEHRQYFEWQILRRKCIAATNPMIPTDTPIEIKRVQFLIRLAFTMTINKS